jgi:ferrochelatase
MTTGFLLVNLGTPASTSVADVRAYLGEFLTDPYVIDLPTPLRQILVRGIILPFRPRRSAEAYAKIWDSAGPGTGSPLLHYSRALHAALTADQTEGRLHGLNGAPCEMAMRYGSPGIDDALERLLTRGVSRVKLLTLYPQHADSTRQTTIEAVSDRLPKSVSLEVIPPFFDDPDYLDVQADVIRRHLPERWDHLLLSYHGLPEAHLKRADPTGSHCLASDDCCEVPSPAHATCYRHQVRVTSAQLARRLELNADQWSVSYQSRLGRLPWLSPYTDQVLAELPSRGIRHLAVACPAFVADNLETLEEIGLAGRETFLEAGGESFALVPCLNDDPAWVSVLCRWLTGIGPQTSAAPSETAR